MNKNGAVMADRVNWYC